MVRKTSIYFFLMHGGTKVTFKSLATHRRGMLTSVASPTSKKHPGKAHLLLQLQRPAQRRWGAEKRDKPRRQIANETHFSIGWLIVSDALNRRLAQVTQAGPTASWHSHVAKPRSAAARLPSSLGSHQIPRSSATLPARAMVPLAVARTV